METEGRNDSQSDGAGESGLVLRLVLTAPGAQKLECRDRVNGLFFQVSKARSGYPEFDD